MSFHDQLDRSWRATGSRLCVGLDPDPDRYPAGIGGANRAFEFCRAIVDATADTACAFKPQVAYFEAQAAEADLQRLCEYIRSNFPEHTLILDAKRGDIGSTARQYAIAAYDRFVAHAVTVNPYLGTDAVEPFLERGGVIALCRTSNPGSVDLQDLLVDRDPLFVRVAQLVANEWASLGECGLVVGATWPGELALVRELAPDLPFLVPGVGAQGGDPAAVIASGLRPDGQGLIISSSRAVLYASSGSDFADAARRAATETAHACS